MRTFLLAGAIVGSVHGVRGSDGPGLRFHDEGERGFAFDTGLLRGRLHADGRSLGLTEVEHVPSRARLDRSNGLLSHYRVFTVGRRYGVGAWDWPSDARQVASNRVEIVFADAPDRPFSMRAVYRLLEAGTIELETSVESRGTLKGLEVFLASYFDAAFTNALVDLGGGSSEWAEATEDRGDWQMYAREPALRSMIQDGRWQLEPHPVEWVFPDTWSGAEALAVRRSVSRGLTAELRAPAADCFAIATPHQVEGHYSTYFSMFGKDLRAGETAKALVVLRIRPEGRR